MTDHQPPPAVEAIGRLEELARALFRARWPGKSWTGCDVSRSYWRRKARAALDRRAGT